MCDLSNLQNKTPQIFLSKKQFFLRWLAERCPPLSNFIHTSTRSILVGTPFAWKTI